MDLWKAIGDKSPVTTGDHFASVRRALMAHRLDCVACCEELMLLDQAGRHSDCCEELMLQAQAGRQTPNRKSYSPVAVSTGCCCSKEASTSNRKSYCQAAVRNGCCCSKQTHRNRSHCPVAVRNSHSASWSPQRHFALKFPAAGLCPKTSVFVCSLVEAVTFSPCFSSVNLTLLLYRFNTMRSVLLL